MSWRAFCRLMDRVSSVGAVPKTSLRTHSGDTGFWYQLTKEAMPFCATIPRADRSSGRSPRYHGRSASSCLRVAVDREPIVERSFSTVAGSGGAVPALVAPAALGALPGSSSGCGILRAYGLGAAAFHL